MPTSTPQSPAVAAITSNPVKTRTDMVNLLTALLAPLAESQSEGGARISLSGGGATFDAIAAELEGYARALWGLAPALAAEPDHPVLKQLGERWARGLDSGTNPDHPEFWGWPVPTDQRFVEMAAIGVTIALCPDQFWHAQSAEAQRRIAEWLLTINDAEIPDNNWRFFRVLVNVGLKSVGGPHSEEAIQETLDHMESFYGEHGFPADGPDGVVTAYDYYATSFAIPFYSLLYTRLNPDARVDKIFGRARANAPNVVHLFAQDGAPIAFGRSMTYRFACASFWSALAWASDTSPNGKHALPAPFSWGVLKGLVLRTIRWFTQKESVFNRDGSLSIGWTYPQVFMSEQYNSPMSPYWALKSMLVLALPQDHPFWVAEEEPIPPQFASGAVVKPWKQTISHAAGHTFLLTQGQHTNWPMRQTAAKYGKMAYSAQFGFSVVGGQYGLGAYAPDSTLALSEDEGEYWKVPRIVRDVIVSDSGAIKSTWEPWSDVVVRTWLIPPPNGKPWHTRVHHIHSARSLRFSTAGFAISSQSGPRGNERLIPITSDLPTLRKKHGRWEGHQGAVATSGPGVSGVFDMLPDDGNRPRVVVADPNTNLIESRTVFPTLTGILTGERWIAVRVFAQPTVNGQEPQWREEWEGLRGWKNWEEMRKEYPFIQ